MRPISANSINKIAQTQNYKIAQESEEGVVQEIITPETQTGITVGGDGLDHLQLILGILRAQYLSYQTSHWQTKGDPAYGNHLLFQRLYESVQEQIDSLAEKLVGLFSTEAVNMPAQVQIIQELCGDWCQEEDLHRRGLESERFLQESLKEAYDALEEARTLTLGLDDWIMATASEHETNSYLLQQVLGE